MVSKSPVNPLRQAHLGFTIIELLVSIGVTALMLTLMITIAINMLNGWNRTSGQLTTGNQARIVLDQLSQDLQSAIIRNDGNVWLAATVQRDTPGTNDDANVSSFFDTDWNAQGQMKPLSSGAPAIDNSLDLAGTLPSDPTDQRKIESLRFGQMGVWLRFFTVPPAENNAANLATTSAPRAVSYQLSRGRLGGANSGQFIYALFRTEIRPVETFRDGYNIINPATYDATAGTSGAIRSPSVDDIIATNVIDFGVRILERNGARLVERFPVERDYATLAGTPYITAPVTYLATSNGAITYNRYGAGSQLTSGVPAAVEIMVRILTPEGARQIQAFEDNKVSRPPDAANDAVYWWRIAEQNSQVYTRRVEVRATAL